MNPGHDVEVSSVDRVSADRSAIAQPCPTEGDRVGLGNPNRVRNFFTASAAQIGDSAPSQSCQSEGYPFLWPVSVACSGGLPP
ncbi:hypothetical protein ACQ4M4_21115 [Leptolyngbya sp. AN02str]|uniref:hypothetical protein n=1 Tax=Leptolyngbya sp. AN02str TaxID=3423363 RepID=UPI003D31D596